MRQVRLVEGTRRFAAALGTPLGGWVFLGLLVRLVLMPLTAHTDALIVPWPARFLALGQPNVYDAMFDLAGWKMITPVALAPYQPLYYAATGAWLWLADAIGWLSLEGWDGHWTLPHLERGLFLLKASYLPFDLGVAFLLAKLVPATRRTVAVGLWMMSPVVIWVAYVMGQNDAMPTFFVVLALLAGARALDRTDRPGRRRWGAAAMLSLGCGAAFKLYPALLVPVFALQLARAPRARVALVALSAVPLAMVALPFLGSHAFMQGALLNIEAQTMLGDSLRMGGQSFSIFVIAYLALLGLLAARRGETTADTLWISCLVVLTLLFTTGQWVFNWLYWLMPFVILAVARVDAAFWLYLVQVAYFLAYRMLWSQEPWLLHFSEQFFAPFGFRDLLRAPGAYERMLTVAASLFFAASWGIVALVYRRRTSHTDSPDSELAPGPARWPWLIPVPLLLVGALFAGLLYGTTQMIPGVVVDSETLEPAAQLSQGTVLTQEFVSDRRNLRAIRVLFGTYDRVNPEDVKLTVRRGEIHVQPAGARSTVRTFGPTAPPLREAVVNGRFLTDNAPYTFVFEPVESSAGTLSFALSSPDAPLGGGVSAYRSTDDVYVGGSHFQNGDVQDSDLAFTAYYAADWREAGHDLRMAMQADRRFFALWAAMCWGLAVLAAGAFMRWGSRTSKAIMALAAAAGIALIVVGCGSATPVAVGDELSYLGHYLPSRQAQPGTPLRLKLYWQSTQPIDADLTAFVHLRDAEGRTVAQDDRPLHATLDPGLHRRIPVTAWLPGEVGVETYDLWLPGDLPPGSYRLVAGVYDPRTMRRLPPSGAAIGEEDVLELPPIQVVP